MNVNEAEYLSHLPAIRALFLKTFKKDIREDFLRWRYSQNPSKKTLVTLGTEGGQLVGHYGCTPTRTQWNGKSMLSGLVASVMTDPSQQGKGLFQRLARENEESARKQGLEFLFAFPNRNSDPIFLRKLGWLPVSDVATLRLDLAAKADQRQVGVLDASVFLDNAFEALSYDQLANRDAAYFAPRTREFLTWRFVNHPVNRYENLVFENDSSGERGYCTYKLYTAEGFPQIDLVDYYANSDQTLERLLSHLIAVEVDQKCKTIGTWSPRHHPFHQVLIRMGFVLAEPVTCLSCKSLSDDSDFNSKIQLFSNWWITMADSDVY